MKNKDAKLAEAFGNLFGVILVAAILAWFIPWATVNSINGLFGASVNHSLANYFYIWVLFFIWRGASLRKISADSH